MAGGWGWRGFLAWAAAGALVVFSVLALASIGIFVLPFALIACWLAARESRDALDALGTVSGAGLVCLGIVALGNLDPLFWIAVGMTLTLGGAVAYAILRCRDAHAGVG